MEGKGYCNGKLITVLSSKLSGLIKQRGRVQSTVDYVSLCYYFLHKLLWKGGLDEKKSEEMSQRKYMHNP